MIGVLKESDSGYDSFVANIMEMVKVKMGKDYTAQIYKITKNNSLELDSLILQKAGKNFASNIYLKPYYQAYLDGASMEEIAEKICSIHHNCSLPILDKEFDFTFETIKKNVVYRLTNYQRNTKLLKKVPHLKFLDLAITFHCLVHHKQDGIGTIRITNDHISRWKVTIEDLEKLAAENTRNLFPPTIRSMEEVIQTMMSESNGNNEDYAEEAMNEIIRNKENSKRMYVLANSHGINGATCLLYSDVLKNFSNHLKSDLFILPSSIHEVILIPFDYTIDKDMLKNMVVDVNQNHVAREEVLSDQVYYFSRDYDAISIA